MNDSATTYNDEYSESFQKYSVNTSMKTLLRLRPIMKALGLGGLLSNGKIESDKIGAGLLAALEDRGLLNEFCQVISGKEGHDFMDEAPGTIMWLVHDFFVGLYWQMPPSWRGEIRASVASIVKLGQIALAEKLGGMTPQTGLTASD